MCVCECVVRRCAERESAGEGAGAAWDMVKAAEGRALGVFLGDMPTNQA